MVLPDYHAPWGQRQGLVLGRIKEEPLARA